MSRRRELEPLLSDSAALRFFRVLNVRRDDQSSRIIRRSECRICRREITQRSIWNLQQHLRINHYSEYTYARERDSLTRVRRSRSSRASLDVAETRARFSRLDQTAEETPELGHSAADQTVPIFRPDQRFDSPQVRRRTVRQRMPRLESPRGLGTSAMTSTPISDPLYPGATTPPHMPIGLELCPGLSITVGPAYDAVYGNPRIVAGVTEAPEHEESNAALPNPPTTNDNDPQFLFTGNSDTDMAENETDGESDTEDRLVIVEDDIERRNIALQRVLSDEHISPEYVEESPSEGGTSITAVSNHSTTEPENDIDYLTDQNEDEERIIEVTDSEADEEEEQTTENVNKYEDEQSNENADPLDMTVVIKEENQDIENLEESSILTEFTTDIIMTPIPTVADIKTELAEDD